MPSYSEFSITQVTPDLSNKQIIISTNFKVDINTVSYSTVAFYDYDAGKLEEYTLAVNGKNIIINLKNYPQPSTRYYLKVDNIKDALQRELNTYYSDAIQFINDITTKVEIISPASRETYKDKTIEVRLKIAHIEKDLSNQNLYYTIEMATDSAFYGKTSKVVCKIPNELFKINNNKFILANNELVITETGLAISITDGYVYNDELVLNTTVEYEGQVYIRARAQSSESVVGDWSEVLSFNIYTISMESTETTFLEEYLTTNEMFDESVLLYETEIIDRSETATNEGLFFIELNKQIAIPTNLEADEDGFIRLGSLLAYRKELK